MKKKSNKVFKLVAARVDEADWKRFKKKCKKANISMNKKIIELMKTV